MQAVLRTCPQLRGFATSSWARSHNQKFQKQASEISSMLTLPARKKHRSRDALKLGYKDSNLEMTESESVALPFGDTPKYSAVYHSHE